RRSPHGLGLLALPRALRRGPDEIVRGLGAPSGDVLAGREGRLSQGARAPRHRARTLPFFNPHGGARRPSGHSIGRGGFMTTHGISNKEFALYEELGGIAASLGVDEVRILVHLGRRLQAKRRQRVYAACRALREQR